MIHRGHYFTFTCRHFFSCMPSRTFVTSFGRGITPGHFCAWECTRGQIKRPKRQTVMREDAFKNNRSSMWSNREDEESGPKGVDQNQFISLLTFSPFIRPILLSSSAPARFSSRCIWVDVQVLVEQVCFVKFKRAVLNIRPSCHRWSFLFDVVSRACLHVLVSIFL
jgi:hypothetical protein